MRSIRSTVAPRAGNENEKEKEKAVGRLGENLLVCRQVASVTALSVKVRDFGAVSNTAL